MTVRPGTRLGAYEILTLLGSGGMGEVYRAKDIKLNRVAVKPPCSETSGIIAPVLAVSGNIDARQDPSLPRERLIPIGGLTLHVSHGDELGRPTAERLLATYDADVIVYGHTHRPLLLRDRGRVVVNPGAAGPRRFNLTPGIAKLVVQDRFARVELIPLS